jgi:2Fe-2S ferredoxin
MLTIHLTDASGQQHIIEAPAGRKLMEILREHDFVVASCGGYCSCATCHVYIDPAWIGRLPEVGYDERELVSILATWRAGESRLSCQVIFTEALDGIRLTVAPEE